MRNIKKRAAVFACAAVLCLSAMVALPGCSGSESNEGATPDIVDVETRTFVDSLGREVQVPVQVDAIASTSTTSQQVLLTMAPEKMVGLAEALDDSQKRIFGDAIDALPVFGSAFSAKGSLNKEALIAASPQVLIDTGDAAMSGLAEDLDALQKQLGVPVVFIETPLDDYATAYTMLGELLGMEERGQMLADYCASTYNEISTLMASVPEGERVNMAYLVGDAGLNAIAEGSYQGTVIEMCANNVVKIDGVTNSGLGNEVNLEQIAVWDPELIVFGKNSIYDTVGDEPAWQGISAITNDRYYQCPTVAWTWLNNPPTVNQILGLQWLPRVCYPELFDNDLQDVVTEYFQLFYGYELSQAEYEEIVAGATA